MIASKWKKFKVFYNKDDCDLSTGYVDPFEFHETFYKVLVARIDNSHPRSCFNQNIVIVIMGLIGITITSMTLYHGFDTFDISLMTETGMYTLLLSYKLFIVCSTWTNLPQYHSLLRALKEDFQYICTVGQKYRAPYFKNQLLTWKICIITCIFSACIPTGMVSLSLFAVFYYLMTHNTEEGGSRPLICPAWILDVDLNRTPIYEVLLAFSSLCTLVYGYNYVFMIQTQIVWIRQITAKADIVVWSIQDLLVDVRPATNEEERVLCDRVIQTRMRDIIIHHQSMYRIIDDYAKVYKKFLMFEEKACSPLVCLTAYCIAEKFDQGEFQGILVLMCIATIILTFIPSYLCTFLASKVSSICDACWDTPFWNASPVIRPYIVLIMQRSLRSLPLQAPGFDGVSIERFAKNMTAAYSYFNMLRQIDL